MPGKTLYYHHLASIIFFSVLLSVASKVAAAPQDSPDKLYHQALEMARSGDFNRALPLLSNLSREYPRIPRYQYDYLLVLLWAGKNDQVLHLSQQIKTETAPDYVLATIARAARNTEQFSKAERLYRILLRRRPQQADYMTGLASVLIDQHKTSEARKLLNKLLSSHPDNTDALMVLAYAEESDNDYLAASKIYEKVLHLKLNYKPAIKGLVYAQSATKSFDLAYQNALLYRHTFSDQDWLKLHWDLAAKLIRWGEIPTEQNKWRYAETHYAITRIKENLKMLDQMQLPDEEIWKNRAYFDLLVAYRDCKKMAEAINLYQQLKQNQIKLPAYATIAAADAFLYAEQPTKARDLYLDVLKEIPNSYNAQQSLVYAYLEAEQPGLALDLAKQMAKQQPKKLWFKKPGSQNKFYSRGNPRKTETELAVAVMEAFTDRLDEAQKKIDFLYKNAPHNVDIRNARANIYYYRGWPRQAHAQLVSALNIDPKHLSNRLSLSPVLHDLRLYAAEQQNTESLYQRYYENKGVQRQMRLWNIHNQRELRIRTQGELSKTQSSEPAPVNGSESVGIDSLLFSQPLAYHYRLFLHQNWQTSVFNDGTGQPVRGYFRRYGLGLEYAIPNLIATGEVHYDNFNQDTVGFAGSLEYQFDDHWSVYTQWDTRSQDIGLRALNSGRLLNNRPESVTAWKLATGAKYQIHESRFFSFNQNFLEYSDSNLHFDENFQYYERWVSGPSYKFSTLVNISTSFNTLQDGTNNYYNPARDASLGVTFDHDFLSYRYYDLNFHQRIALTSGLYFQKKIAFPNGLDNQRKVNFLLRPVGSIQYEHRWKTLDRYELIYGAIRRYAVYDGDRTEDWAFYLNLSMRF